MIEVRNLSKQYNDKTVVNDVSQIGRASCRERV